MKLYHEVHGGVRALIPCGGRGTRMRSIAGDGPKEMVPIAGRPAIDWVLGECAESGIDEILVVAAPGKDALVQHLSRTPGVEIAIQREPRGLADAIRLGREFAADQPLAVALPDNIFVAPTPALAQVLHAHRTVGTNIVAIVEISAREAVRRGATAALDGERVGAAYRITHISDKGARAAMAYTAVGRFVFLPEALAAIDIVEKTIPAGAELDDVPLMQWLLARGELEGRVIEGQFLDVGLPSGYSEANDLLSR
jgi:UTP--glucose-1-phosphate uridylyltransferase